MKKLLQIIIVIILIAAFALIIWSSVSPDSFSRFFLAHPEINDTINQIKTLNKQPGELSDATSSEPISGLTGRVTIGNNTWNVEIAGNEQDRVNGLSSRKTLYPKKGMLFAFDKMGTQSFWMKDMLISLDMIFFDDNWKIVEIDSNLSPSSFPEIFGNKIKSQYVLEINAGEADSYGLKVNDQAIFQNK